MNTDTLARVTDRMRTGMSPEAAIGLEWRLMRQREGFTGLKWGAHTGRSEMSQEAIATRVAILRMLMNGGQPKEYILANVNGKNATEHLGRMRRSRAVMVDADNKTEKLVHVITDIGRDWLKKHDVQGSLF